MVNAEQIKKKQSRKVERHKVFILFPKPTLFLMSSAAENVCLYVVLSIKQTQKDVDSLFIHLFKQFGNELQEIVMKVLHCVWRMFHAVT